MAFLKIFSALDHGHSGRTNITERTRSRRNKNWK